MNHSAHSYAGFGADPLIGSLDAPKVRFSAWADLSVEHRV